MSAGFDLDHTSFAVPDALTWAHRLRSELGATPIAGETLPDFRYLLLYIGDATSGARLELLEPVREGFLTRFLDRHGAGPHHITFTVPDLEAAVDAARAAGATVVGEEYEHPAWREAFIAPDVVHGVVIQLAQSDRSYPERAELLRTTARDITSFPSSRGATDPLWWTSLWQTPAGGSAQLGATWLGSTDLEFSRRLFADVLGGEVQEGPDRLRLLWPGGSLDVHPSEIPGVTGMTLHGAPPGGFTLGWGNDDLQEPTVP